MSTTPVISQVELENTVGATNVARYFDDDGDGKADSQIIADYLSRGSARARGILYASFSSELVERVTSDERFIDCVCWITLGMCGRRRQEWMMQDGGFPFSVQKKEAEAELLMIAKGLDRLASEEQKGSNATLPGATSPNLPVCNVFAPSRRNPTGRGGF